MVTYHSSLVTHRKEVYNRLRIWHLDITYHPQDRMVTHHPKDDIPPTVEWSTTYPRDGYQFSKAVAHHFKDSQLDLEFYSSTTQLVLAFFFKKERSRCNLSYFWVRVFYSRCLFSWL